MCKKLLITVLAVVVGVGVVSGTRLGSLARYWWHTGVEKVQREIPPETEIGRLKLELDNLSRLDDRYFDEVARQKLEVRKLESKVKLDKDKLAKFERQLKNMRVALSEEGNTVSYNGSEYPRDRMQREFNQDFKHFLVVEEGVKADAEVLDTLKTKLSESELQIQELGSLRAKMQARLQTLHAKLQRERRLQNHGSIVIDGNRYANLEKQLDELHDRIESMSIKRELKGQASHGSIRAQEEAKEEQKRLEKQAEERFGGKKVTAETN